MKVNMSGSEKSAADSYREWRDDESMEMLPEILAGAEPDQLEQIIRNVYMLAYVRGTACGAEEAGRILLGKVR